jgi:hypothetical protein
MSDLHFIGAFGFGLVGFPLLLAKYIHDPGARVAAQWKLLTLVGYVREDGADG